jgi:uncharacterized damage-inducible protein DinB
MTKHQKVAIKLFLIYLALLATHEIHHRGQVAVYLRVLKDKK